MNKYAYHQGQIDALTRLGLYKQADLVEELAAAEAAGGGHVPAAPAGPKKGLFQMLKGKITPRNALAVGLIGGGGLMLHRMNQPPQVEVVPSAPLGATMYP